MMTIFDEETRRLLINRIKLLRENNEPQWGKMNIHQMLGHCIKYEKMMQGKVKYKRAFIGYLFGKLALKSDFLKDDSPIKKNTPTLSQLKTTEYAGNFETDKKQWIRLINDYNDFQAKEIIHPFFGKLSPEQVGYLVYKHTDHHLRQFNC